ncbi:hypothetical protein FRC07_000699 [Ceratobasidium sp. 392]|nr:hypothetical protein FRC07_000699 [Ceratobasidium sp. 392]
MSAFVFDDIIDAVPTSFITFVEVGNAFVTIYFGECLPSLDTVEIQESIYRIIVGRLTPDQAFEEIDAQLAEIHDEFQAAFKREMRNPKSKAMAFFEQRERYLGRLERGAFE